MTNKNLLGAVVLGLALAAAATSEVLVVEENKEAKVNEQKSDISEAAVEDETRSRSQLDPLTYSINVTMINYGSVEAKVQQRYLFPDGVEVKLFTLQNDGYRTKRSTDNQFLTQWVGGSVNLKHSDIKEADMTYVNHPAEVINPNSKTFHKLSTAIMIKEGDLVGGQIFSPNYPLSYPDGADLTWLIVYPAGNVVKLEMEDYATEECCDRLVAYDGYSQSHYPLATFDGYYSYGSENVVFTTQPAMFIRFTSDCLLTNRGFRANYINQPTDGDRGMSCGDVQQTNSNEGYIESPNYPGTYDAYMNCTWSVQTYYNTRVKFVLHNFSVGYDDQVAFYEGTPNNPGNRIATLSGYYYSGYTFYGSSNQAFIAFSSGYSSYYSNRFVIAYEGETNDPETTTAATTSCGYVQSTGINSGYIDSPGYPNTYSPYMYCTWNVQTNYNTRVKFVITNFYTGYDDTVTFYDSNAGNMITQLSGSYYSGYTFYATSYRAYIIFTSGSSSYYANKFVISYSGEYAPETTTESIEPTSAIDSCGDVDFTGSYTGYIDSPNYPYQYPPNSYCTWAVTTEYGTDVAFVVQNFNLPSGDYVDVYDGSPYSYNNYVRRMTGSYYSGYTITTYSNRGFLRFDSRSYTYSGYKFRFYFYGAVSETTTVDSGEATTYEGSADTYYYPSKCNGNSEYICCSGYIYSTGYSSPGYYPNNEYCIWYVSVSSSYDAVYFHPHYFSTESGYDWVRIYNGYSTSSNNLVAQASGYLLSNEYVVTSSKYATMTFTSDGSITDRGFYIHYYGTYSSYYYYPTSAPVEETTISYSCQDSYESGYSGYVQSPNYPSNYDINMNCSTYVNTPYGTYVLLTVQSFYLSTGDYLRIYNAFTNQLLTTFSAYKSYGESWQASTNYIRLEFYSDSLYTGSGYQFRYDSDYGYNSYTTVPPSNCGQAMPYNGGTITSMNYPYDYNNGLDCIWTVYVSSSKYVLFTIQYFQTESCCDYVGFYSGTPGNSSGLVRRLQGYVSPSTEILVQNDQAVMTFYTDGSVTAKGFSIQYSNVPTYYVPSGNTARSSNDVEAQDYEANPRGVKSGLKAEGEEGPRTLGKDLWANAKHKPKHLHKEKEPQPQLKEKIEGKAHKEDS